REDAQQADARNEAPASHSSPPRICSCLTKANMIRAVGPIDAKRSRGGSNIGRGGNPGQVPDRRPSSGSEPMLGDQESLPVTPRTDLDGWAALPTSTGPKVRSSLRRGHGSADTRTAARCARDLIATPLRVRALSAPFREVTFCASYKCHCFG